MSNLFQVSQKYLSIENLLIESGGVLTPELEALLNITEAERDEAVRNIFYLMQEKAMEIDGMKERIKSFDELVKRKEITYNSCKKALERAVMTFGAMKVDEFGLGLRKSEAVNVYDETQLKKEFLTEKISYSPDKKKIKEALKKGEALQGAEIITNQNLQIK